MSDVPDDGGSRRAADDAALVEALWATWAERGSALTATDWTAPTRLGGWTVRELYAHVAPVAGDLLAFLSTPSDGPAAATRGADILRAFNRPDGVAHVAAPAIAEAASQTAATVPTSELVDRFRAVTAPEVVARLRSIPQDSVVPHPVLGTVTVAALTEVSVMELTVHLLDLIDAVGGPPAPPAAVRRALEIVTEVAEPAALLEALTGRGGGGPLPLIR